jgi:hypothetical protein
LLGLARAKLDRLARNEPGHEVRDQARRPASSHRDADR